MDPALQSQPQSKVSVADPDRCKPKSYSETRWWSKWEVFKLLLEQFGDVE